MRMRKSRLISWRTKQVGLHGNWATTAPSGHKQCGLDIVPPLWMTRPNVLLAEQSRRELLRYAVHQRPGHPTNVRTGRPWGVNRSIDSGQRLPSRKIPYASRGPPMAHSSRTLAVARRQSELIWSMRASLQIPIPISFSPNRKRTVRRRRNGRRSNVNFCKSARHFELI